MADYETFFPGRFLKGAQIPPGKPTKIEIVGCKADELPNDDGGEDQKLLLLIKMRLPTTGQVGNIEVVWNKTNCILTSEGYGRDTEGWIGKVLFIHLDEKVKVGKETKGGIRVYGFPSSVWPETKTIEIKRPRRKVPDRYVLHSVAPPTKGPANGTATPEQQ